MNNMTVATPVDAAMARFNKAAVANTFTFHAMRNAEALNLCQSMNATDKKLIAAWPEVEQFIPYPDKPKSTAVALDVKTLNEICGIPR